MSFDPTTTTRVHATVAPGVKNEPTRTPFTPVISDVRHASAATTAPSAERVSLRSSSSSTHLPLPHPPPAPQHQQQRGLTHSVRFLRKHVETSQHPCPQIQRSWMHASHSGVEMDLPEIVLPIDPLGAAAARTITESDRCSHSSSTTTISVDGVIGGGGSCKAQGVEVSARGGYRGRIVWEDDEEEAYTDDDVDVDGMRTMHAGKPLVVKRAMPVGEQRIDHMDGMRTMHVGEQRTNHEAYGDASNGYYDMDGMRTMHVGEQRMDQEAYGVASDGYYVEPVPHYIPITAIAQEYNAPEPPLHQQHLQQQHQEIIPPAQSAWKAEMDYYVLRQRVLMRQQMYENLLQNRMNNGAGSNDGGDDGSGEVDDEMDTVPNSPAAARREAAAAARTNARTHNMIFQPKIPKVKSPHGSDGVVGTVARPMVRLMIAPGADGGSLPHQQEFKSEMKRTDTGRGIDELKPAKRIRVMGDDLEECTTKVVVIKGASGAVASPKKSSSVRETAAANKSKSKKGGPRPNFCKEVTDVLTAFFDAYFDPATPGRLPYPTQQDKEMLSAKTGLNIKQVNDWFINARRRRAPMKFIVGGGQ